MFLDYKFYTFLRDGSGFFGKGNLFTVETPEQLSS